ncbi:hypothetical protein FA95DRAFT_1657094, partial [Auriscalpium vulgare]
TVRIWDAETGQPIGPPLEGHTGWVTSVAYSSDERHIVSGSSDNTVRIWDAETGRPMGTTFSPHSQHILNEPETLHTLHTSKSVHLTETHDGWIVYSAASPPALLLWLPPANRSPGLYTPYTHLIIGASPTILDLSGFAHGPNWHKIYDETVMIT